LSQTADPNVPGRAAPIEVEAGSPQAWLYWLGLVIGIEAWIVAWYGESFASMADIWWRSETFAHGLIVYPMSAWLIWRKRAEIASVAPRPCAWALLPMAGAGLGWLIAAAGGVQAGEHFCLVVLIALAPWAVLGSAVARLILFPLAFTLFAAPIGEFLMPWMMQHTADFTIAALRATGIPVYREGLHFVIPTGSWSVVEACSGLRYLIASVMLGVLFAYLTYRSFTRRAIFVVAAIITPIIANWLRAYMIVMIGHLSGMTLAVGVDHLIYGWFFFGLIMLALFWIGSYWREDLDTRPIEHKPQQTRFSLLPPYSAAALVLVTALTAAFWPHYASSLDDFDRTRTVALAAPPAPGGWRHEGSGGLSFEPRYTGARARLTETYARENERVTLYVRYYFAQGEGAELINFHNTILPSKDSEWTKLHERPVMVVPGQLTGVETRIKGSQSLTVWHWYWVGGRWTSSREEAKVYHALGRLLGGGDDSAIIAIYTGGPESGSEVANKRLGEFAQHILPQLEVILQKAKSANDSAASSGDPTRPVVGRDPAS